MKKLVLICEILASALTVGYSAMSQTEIERARDNCVKNDKSACQELIDNGLASVKQCGKDEGKDGCVSVGCVYGVAGYHREAIPYFEKAIVLGDSGASYFLGVAYEKLNDYLNAKKYYEISCNADNENQSRSCYNLGLMYDKGQGVKQKRSIAKQYYGKSCDLGVQQGCDNYNRLDNAGVQ